MPLIKPRTRGKDFVRLIAQVEHENFEALHAYAEFISEPPDYVLNQLIDGVLAKDKEFVTWRSSHPESYAPKKQPGRRAKAPASIKVVAARG